MKSSDRSQGESASGRDPRCPGNESLHPTVGPLSALKPGEGGAIDHVHTEEAKTLQKLMAIGVLPGINIKLLRRFPSYVFQIGHSQFAVDEGIASAIFVRLTK